MKHRFEGHTPGPWSVDPTVDGDDGLTHFRNIRTGNRFLQSVAEVTSVDYGNKLESTADTDASLIAASPDLLRAGVDLCGAAVALTEELGRIPNRNQITVELRDTLRQAIVEWRKLVEPR